MPPSAVPAAAVACMLSCLVLSAHLVAASRPQSEQRKPAPPAPKPPSPQPPPKPGAQIQKPLHAGYVPISRTDSSNPSSLYYAYWEAAAPAGGAVDDQTPIILWLQGGPGCASSFGALYELGPTVVDSSGVPTPNPYSFNQAAGLLAIDQPIGTGYSIAGSTEDIPTDMQGMAADLYEGLWSFFDSHPQLQPRPFFITGESYAGKYIPSLTHYILRAAANRPWHQQQQQEEQQGEQLRSQPQQQKQQDDTYCSRLEQLQRQLRSSKQQPVLLLPLLRRRALQRCPGLLRHAQQQQQQQQGVNFQDGVPDPNFQLAGIAIGNGLTDPIAQTRALGSVTFNFGLISEATRTQLQQQAEVVITLVQAQQWAEAAQMRSRLLQFIEQASGVATLLDIRRTAVYDSAEAVQSLLNSTEVKALMSADAYVDYASCSDAVDAVLKADTMKSASALVEDILDVLPVLLYQGQFDAQDGVASTNAWLAGLSWEYARDFAREPGQVWQVGGLPAGWQRGASTLTQVVVRNAGHMVPRDQPKAALQLLQGWMQGQLVNYAAAEAAAAELQQQLDSGSSSSSSMGGVSTS
uniref:Carboxypeptidase n=1 Tax=Tetradesmus obliquus TaxID=3088 RepID=A0A383V966_TETOB|eukprot:jgi/Sobl393_1/16338/SZX62125.1